jgi:hypothetical protein
MIEAESRQVRRARERREASPAKRAPLQRLAGNRAARRAERKNDSEAIVRSTRLNAVASCKRARRDYRIRHELRPARGMVHPRTISHYRYTAMQFVAFIFAVAAKRAEQRRAATA